VDIVVEQNRIVQISSLGSPGSTINPARRPQLKEGGKELNCEGMFAMPGLIDMHGHIGGTHKALLQNMFLNYGWRMALPPSENHQVQ
jgi:imidazolonepropionase-like amidohydrolase